MHLSNNLQQLLLVLEIFQFFFQQLAYIASKLDAVQEGERTALDNTILMMCSSMLTGTHDATQLPVVILGGGGGKKVWALSALQGAPMRLLC